MLFVGDDDQCDFLASTPSQCMPRHLLEFIPRMHQLGLDHHSIGKLIASGVDDLETVALLEECDLRRIGLNIGDALGLKHFAGGPGCQRGRAEMWF